MKTVIRLTARSVATVVVGPVLVFAIACASVPVRQVQVAAADSIKAISDLVLEVQSTSHTAALALNTAPALRADIAVQEGARAYGVKATGVLAKVKAAPSTAAALVRGAPAIAAALELLEALRGVDLGPGVNGLLVRLQALLDALSQP